MDTFKGAKVTVTLFWSKLANDWAQDGTKRALFPEDSVMLSYLAKYGFGEGGLMMKKDGEVVLDVLPTLRFPHTLATTHQVGEDGKLQARPAAEKHLSFVLHVVGLGNASDGPLQKVLLPQSLSIAKGMDMNRCPGSNPVQLYHDLCGLWIDKAGKPHHARPPYLEWSVVCAEADKFNHIGDTKRQVQRDLLFPFTLPHTVSGVSNPNGALFWGPPGSGKTQLVRHFIMEKCGVRPIWFGSGPELSRKYVGETEAELKRKFEACHETPNLLCCVVIDEIDTLTAKREKNQAEHKSDWLGLLLRMLGSPDYPNVIILGTTNRKHIIDEAFLRSGRMELKFFCGRLLSSDRRRIFERHLNQAVSVDLPSEFDRLSLNFTGALLQRCAESFKTELLYMGLRNVESNNTLVRSVPKGPLSILSVDDDVDDLSLARVVTGAVAISEEDEEEEESVSDEVQHLSMAGNSHRNVEELLRGLSSTKQNNAILTSLMSKLAGDDTDVDISFVAKAPGVPNGVYAKMASEVSQLLEKQIPYLVRLESHVLESGRIIFDIQRQSMSVETSVSIAEHSIRAPAHMYRAFAVEVGVQIGVHFVLAVTADRFKNWDDAAVDEVFHQLEEESRCYILQQSKVMIVIDLDAIVGLSPQAQSQSSSTASSSMGRHWGGKSGKSADFSQQSNYGSTASFSASLIRPNVFNKVVQLALQFRMCLRRHAVFAVICSNAEIRSFFEREAMWGPSVESTCFEWKCDDKSMICCGDQLRAVKGRQNVSKAYALPGLTNGRHFWYVQIIHTDFDHDKGHLEQAPIHVGVSCGKGTSVTINLSSERAEAIVEEGQKSGSSSSSSKKKSSKDKKDQSIAAFHEGDTAGILLDLTARRICFYHGHLSDAVLLADRPLPQGHSWNPYIEVSPGTIVQVVSESRCSVPIPKGLSVNSVVDQLRQPVAVHPAPPQQQQLANANVANAAPNLLGQRRKDQKKSHKKHHK